MKEIVQWLVTVEERAYHIYLKASEIYQKDHAFFEFLSRSASEESWHYNMMKKAEKSLDQSVNLPDMLILDEETMHHVEESLGKINDVLNAGDRNKMVVLQCIADAEFSEWNDIFLYAVMSCLENHKECQTIAAQIERHKQSIAEYMASLPGGSSFEETFLKIPAIWERTILIVEDDYAVQTLLRGIFKREGKITLAADGEEGLAVMKGKYFDLILSDVDMPLMSGINMYRKASDLDPDLKDRILFFTGTSGQDEIEFLKENNLNYLTKPSSLREIRTAAGAILKRPPLLPSQE